MLSVGVAFYRSCPALNIPIALITMGSLITSSNLINMIVHFSHTTTTVTRSAVIVTLNVVINSAAIVTFFLMCAWIYGKAEPDYGNVLAPNYCHPVLYMYCYWLVTSVVAIVWLLSLFSFIFWCLSSQQ